MKNQIRYGVILYHRVYEYLVVPAQLQCTSCAFSKECAEKLASDYSTLCIDLEDVIGIELGDEWTFEFHDTGTTSDIEFGLISEYKIYEAKVKERNYLCKDCAFRRLYQEEDKRCLDDICVDFEIFAAINSVNQNVYFEKVNG